MALNFRDTLVATGDLHVKFFEPSDDNTKLGYEYSGITKNGRRVMGMIFLNEFNTELQADCDFTWDVPSRWTLEEAATVPIVYATVRKLFFLRLHTKKKIFWIQNRQILVTIERNILTFTYRLSLKQYTIYNPSFINFSAITL